MNIGTIVTGLSRTYRIDKRLGEGVTSEVYRAVELSSGALVALKVLRDGVGPIIEANFWQEGQVLGEFANAARAAGDERADVPLVVETRRVGEMRFLAMELVVGQPLDRVLEEKEWLPEREALFVAQKVLHVLELLHGQVRRTYTDFQLQNIWLQRDANGVLTDIKVMDWNHVSERVKEGQPLPVGFAQADLARFAAYFYRMLTGKGADERGEVEHVLAARAGERWDALSRGVQQLVLRALRPNVTRRFAKATDFRQAVHSLQYCWQQDPLDLIVEVKLWIDRLTDESNDEDVGMIEGALDIAEAQGGNLAQINARRRLLQEFVGEVSLAWKTGERYYKADQYREAVNNWRQEAETKGRVALWRRVMLAQVGVELGRRAFAPLRASIQQAVEELNAGQKQSALDKLAQLQTGGRSSESLKLLRQEALIQVQMQLAQQEEQSQEAKAWEQALERYEYVQQSLPTIPYAKELQAEEQEWPDLAQRIEELSQRIREHGTTSEVLAQVEREFNKGFADGVAELSKQLKLHPTHRPLVDLCLRTGNHYLNTRPPQPNMAAQLFGIGVLFGQVESYKLRLRQSWKDAMKDVHHEKTVASIKAKHQAELEDLKKKQLKEKESEQGKLNALKDHYRILQQNQQQQIAGLQQQHKINLRNRREAQQEALRKQREGQQQVLRQQQEGLKAQEQALAALRQEYQSELQKLQQELDTLRENHANAVRAERENNQQELDTLRQNHSNAVRAERENNQQELANLRRIYKETLDKEEREREKRQKSLLEQYEQELANTKAAHEQELQRLQQELADAKTAHEQEWQHLRGEHQQQLADAKAFYEGQLASKTSKYEQELADKQREHENALETATQNNEQQLTDLQNQHDQQLTDLQNQHDQYLVGKQQEYEAAVAKVEQEFQQRLQALEPEQQEKLESAKSDYEQELGRYKKLKGELEADTKALQTEHATQMAKIKGELEAKTKELKEQHEGEIAGINRQHEEAVTALKAQHEGEIEGINRQHEEAVPTLKTQHEGEIGGINRQHEDAVNALNALNEGKIGDINRQHEDAVAALKAQHEGEIGDINRQHEDAVNALNALNEGEIGDINRQHQKAVTALNALNEGEIGGINRQHEEAVNALNALNEGEIGDINRQHQKAVTALKAQHSKTERRLAKVRQQHEAALNAEQSELEKLLASLQPKNDKRLIEELNKLLEEERWDDFLTLAAKTPEGLLAGQRMHWRAKVVKLNKRFTGIINSNQIPLAQKLLGVLAVLEPDSRHKKWRKDEYNRVLGKFDQDIANWPNQIAKLVEKRRWQASRVEDYRQLVGDIERLLAFSHPQLTQWLEDTRQQVFMDIQRLSQQGANYAPQTRQQGSSRQGANLAPQAQTRRQPTQIHQQQTYASVENKSPVTREQQRVELSHLIQAGFSQVGLLTVQSLRDAESLFEQALELINLLEDDTLRARVLAANRLIRRLDRPFGTNLSNNDLREFLRLAYDPKQLEKWLPQASVVQWIEEARKYLDWANQFWINNKKKEAYRFSQAAFKLLSAIETIIYGWWREVRGFDERLDLPALRRLKTHVQRQPFFRG